MEYAAWGKSVFYISFIGFSGTTRYLQLIDLSAKHYLRQKAISFSHKTQRTRATLENLNGRE